MNTLQRLALALVTSRINNNALRLVVDDFDYFSTIPHLLRSISWTEYLFVVACSQATLVGGRSAPAPFTGCIAPDPPSHVKCSTSLEPYKQQQHSPSECGVPPPRGVQSRSCAVGGTDSAFNPYLSPPTTWTCPGAPQPPPWHTARAGVSLAYDPILHCGRSDIATDSVSGQTHQSGKAESFSSVVPAMDSRIEYSKSARASPTGDGPKASPCAHVRTACGLVCYAAADRRPHAVSSTFYMKRCQGWHFKINCGVKRCHLIFHYITTRSGQRHLTRRWRHGNSLVDSELGEETSVAATHPPASAAPYYYGVKDIDKLNPSISQTYHTVKARQDELENRRKEADDKLLKLKELIEQVNLILLMVCSR
uniref:Uncharacterized protein n=1 Tax=Heliothis virescens TaxID=7102 RepID=A0A2A4JXV1_HELVI